MQARDELAGAAPSLAVLLASRSHADKAGDVLKAVQETVEPPALIGCVAQTIVAGRREIEHGPAVAVWLASGLAAETFAAGLRAHRLGWAAGRLPVRPGRARSALCCCRIRTRFRRVCSSSTSIPICRERRVVGGVVSGGRGPGDTRLFRDHDVLSSGLVGVRLPGMHAIPIVSQGCRPIGHPYIVTAAQDDVITELGGRSPLQRLQEIVAEVASRRAGTGQPRPADRDRRRRAPGGSGAGRLHDSRAAGRRLFERGDRGRRGGRGRRDRAIPGS